MGRSIKKGPFVEGHLLEKIAKAKAANQKTPIKTRQHMNFWVKRYMATYCGRYLRFSQKSITGKELQMQSFVNLK